MTKKKVCFIVPEYRSDSSTHFPYIFEMIACLSSDFQIRCIIERSSGMPSLPDSVELYAQQQTFLLFRIAQTKINIFRARMAGYRDFYVHYSFFSAFFASLAVRVFGGSVFYWNCGLPWQYKRSWFRERFERLVYKMITFLVTGTEGLKKKYAQNYSVPLEKIKILPNWIDVEKIKNQSASWRTKIKVEEVKNQLNILQSAKVLLFVHRLSKRKGAHYIPKIMNLLRDENVVLLVAGDGPEKQHLKFEIRNWKLEDQVRLLGCVPHNEVVKYFAIADIFIMPSEEEGFPHVLLEAMASGIPFVASNVGGVADIVPPFMRNYLVKTGNINLFSQYIKELISQNADEDEFEKTKQLLINWVRRYDISVVASKFVKIIK